MQTIKHMTTIAVALFALAAACHRASTPAPTQLANSPLSGASSVEISPNVLFVLDDSGSMDWDFLPDWAGEAPTNLNGAAMPASTASPTTRRSPIRHPSISQALTAQPDTTTYPSQTAANTSGWTAVKDDGYGLGASASTRNLVGSAYLLYDHRPANTAPTKSLKNSWPRTATAAYPVAAKLRWCKTAADCHRPDAQRGCLPGDRDRPQPTAAGRKSPANIAVRIRPHAGATHQHHHPQRHQQHVDQQHHRGSLGNPVGDHRRKHRSAVLWPSTSPPASTPAPSSRRALLPDRRLQCRRRRRHRHVISAPGAVTATPVGDQERFDERCRAVTAFARPSTTSRRAKIC
jgi:hypothetical protein